MKKIKMLSLLVLLLTGCNNNSSSTIINSSSISSSSSLITSSKKEEGYYKEEEQSIDYETMRRSFYYKDIPSIGDANILVVPVKFKDSNYTETKYTTYSNMRENIEKAFFGESQDTGWESISSYYKKSSYGKLNIKGEVTDWFTTDKTFEEITKFTLKDYTDPTIYILRQVDDWYKENYGDASKYDLDKDGYIDAIYMIYDAPYLNKNKIDWAYTTWDFLNEEEPDVNSPIAYTYAWASVDFLYDGNYKDENNNTLVDAHTLIHETGHLLGLEDYYDYDGTTSPLGSLDMMDTNIGDHNGYSKYSLGWTNPYVVINECEITIKPFESSGDIILVKNDWNKSSMDEYLLIEFYTPTGLNELDSLEQYAGIYPKMFQKPGIKIYHIDSRLGYYEGYSFKHYTDILDENDDGLATSTQLAHSNTTSQSCDKDYKLVRLLERGGTNFLNSKSVSAKDSMLFREGDVFDPIDFELVFDKEEYFNDGEYINYLIEIVKITDEEATLKFTVIDEELK